MRSSPPTTDRRPPYVRCLATKSFQRHLTEHYSGWSQKNMKQRGLGIRERIPTATESNWYVKPRTRAEDARGQQADHRQQWPTRVLQPARGPTGSHTIPQDRSYSEPRQLGKLHS
ncbi:hypothetical protein J6590_069151 [Homalodisca vitripennis]|nr:hypothetical protein J6590_069151 [Homalodisca vitripennis]